MLLLTDAETILEENMTETLVQILDVKNWFGNLGTSALDFILQAAFCVLIYYIIAKILKRILAAADAALEKRGTDPTARHFMITLIKTVVLGFTVLSMIIQLNIVDATSIAALLASAGVGISLALEDALSNFAGGILLLTLRPFKEGDFITVKDTDIAGTVTKITLYYTTLHTTTRETLVVPNSKMTGDAVVNSGVVPGQKFLSVKVGISYHSDVDRALEILDQIMDDEPRVQRKLRTIIDEFGESSVVIGLRCFVNIDDYMDVGWDMNAQIWKRFHEEGIEIPFNQLDVHIKDIQTGDNEKNVVIGGRAADDLRSASERAGESLAAQHGEHEDAAEDEVPGRLREEFIISFKEGTSL